MRQRLAVHLVGDEGVLIHCLPDGDALDEIRRLVHDRAVGAVEQDFDRFLLEAHLVEQVLELGAFPAGAAHGAVAPLDAGHMRLEQPAPVARALIDGDELVGRHLLEIVERDCGLAVGALAADVDLPGLRIDLGNIGEMIAHEERIVGGDGGAEIFNRRLVVRRPITELDQRLLAGQRVEYSP